MPFNQDQVLSFVRWVIATFGGYLIGRGIVTADQLTMIGAAVASLIPLIWSFISHTDTAKLKAVEAMPEVAKITTVTPTVANSGTAAIEAAADVTRPKVSA